MLKNRYLALCFTGALAACGGGQAALDDVGQHQYGVTVCDDGTTLRGIDVSYYQGTIQWGQVYNDGRRFAIIRVSDGIGFEDPKFESYWSNSDNAGLVQGAYQFFRPNQNALDQADLMIRKLNAVGFRASDIPPVLDVEVTGGESNATIANKINNWVDRVRNQTGRKPIIYTSPGFWSSIGNPDIPNTYLWVAHWTTASCPSIPPTWAKWRFWQHSSTGSVNGISGNVDLDRFNGTLAEVKSL